MKALISSQSKYIKLTYRVYITEGFANIKDHPKENIKATFTNNSVDLIILNWKGKSFRFSCPNLNKEIVPEESSVRQGSSGLTINLKKVKTETWDILYKKESLIKDPTPTKDPNDPTAGLMDMMKQMYQNGDE